jgi:hypothetical protein
MKISTISPAYGRDYKNKKDIQKDFDDNKDFIIEDFMNPYCGKYVNKEQMEQDSVQVRYAKMTKICNIKVR